MRKCDANEKTGRTQRSGLSLILGSVVSASLKLAGFCRLFDGDGHRDGGADHRVVAHADEAHHVDMRGDGGAAGELRVAVHAAHGVGHAVARGAGCHVVGVQRASRTAARGDGEVFLAVLGGPLFVCAGDGVLEARRVCRVAGDGDVDTLVPHDRHALVDVVGAVAFDLRLVAVGEGLFHRYLKFPSVLVVERLHEGEAVDA